MDSREFDNICVASLPDLLDERRTIARYFPLIPYRERIVRVLTFLNIRDKYQYLEAPREERDIFAREVGFEPGMESLFARFLRLYDLKERRLSEIRETAGFSLDLTNCGELRTSEDYLRHCMNSGIGSAAGQLRISVGFAYKLFCLCDLMRLPGVKWLRAGLYYDCGYQSLQAFARQNPENMRGEIAEFIRANRDERSAPQPKEIATQVAVAGALPHILAS